MTGGSKVNLFGSQFVLGGTDITSTLTPNVPFTVTSRNILLTGILADGTPFDFDLRSDDELNRDYFATNAVLTITLITTNLGDFNRDSTVNAADYTVWRNSRGSFVGVGKLGDGNFDGYVNDGDYLVWKAHYGQSASGAAPLFRNRKAQSSSFLPR